MVFVDMKIGRKGIMVFLKKIIVKSRILCLCEPSLS